jgi:hypothetical protein
MMKDYEKENEGLNKAEITTVSTKTEFKNEILERLIEIQRLFEQQGIFVLLTLFARCVETNSFTIMYTDSYEAVGELCQKVVDRRAQRARSAGSSSVN